MVSTIICFYNEEKFLSESIESVLMQSYTQWELILVDDGSTDKSSNIAKSYCVKYPSKIKYYHHQDHQNQGLSASRNLGISKSTGDFIAFLDGDDAWFPDKLENQLLIMKDNPEAEMICGATKYWHSWQKDDSKDIIIPVGSPQNTMFKPPDLIKVLYPLGKGAAPSMSGIIARRSAILKIGGFEEEFTGMYEDQAFLAKTYLSHNVWVSDICFDKYRQHTESMFHVSVNKGGYHKIRAYFLDWLKRYIKKQKIKDEKTRHLLRKARIPYQFPILYRFYKKFATLKNIFKK